MLGDALDSFDYGQMFGQTGLFDGNAVASGNAQDLPFVTTQDNTAGTSGTMQPQSSSFWGSLGNSVTGLVSGLSSGAIKSLPAILNNITSPSDPNPANAGKEQQTTAQKQADQQGQSWVKWAIIGVVGVAVAVGGWLLLRPKRGK